MYGPFEKKDAGKGFIYFVTGILLFSETRAPYCVKRQSSQCWPLSGLLYFITV